MNEILKKAFNPLRLFLSDSRAVGIILLICTFLSLMFANSFLGESYRNFWNAALPTVGSLNLPSSLGHWINDFLMAFFFLLAGMEIKRELVVGEMSSLKKAVLPFGAALGGMVVPALIFLLNNSGTGHSHGWGIPTATDIAFSLGAASLFGKRVPVGLKILLMALAIIDDLGAIIIIAVFYGAKMHFGFLIASGVIYLLLWVCNRFKIRFGIVQVILSLLLWYALLNAGIEGSIAGVLVALATPVHMLPRIEKRIFHVVNFFIMPLFALANTAILIRGNIVESLGSSIAIGVMMGLVIGKPVGIFLFSRLLVAFKIAKLPQNVNWTQVLCMGTLAGIGFTMSIFTTTLAYEQETLRNIAKIAILFSMVISGMVSWVNFIFSERIVAKIANAFRPATPAAPHAAIG